MPLKIFQLKPKSPGGFSILKDIVKKDALGREKFLKSGSGRTYLKKQLKEYLNQS